ncbi:MAG: haloacid dehalogenase type II [Acidimicrobiia bacterium]
MAKKKPMLAFDINETLLSLAPIRERLEGIFGEDPPTGEWFSKMLHGSLVANDLDQYRDFSEIGVEALLAVAAKHGVSLKGEAAEEVVAAMRRLPPHPEVYNALERLFDAGFVMIALTNGGTASANAQIENAGLHIFVRRVVSVEEVRRFKPDALPYRHAAQLMEVDVGEMMLVAAHDWDCAGAMAAGAQAAYVNRPGSVWGLPVDPPPMVVGDIKELADALVTKR